MQAKTRSRLNIVTKNHHNNKEKDPFDWSILSAVSYVPCVSTYRPIDWIIYVREGQCGSVFLLWPAAAVTQNEVTHQAMFLINAGTKGFLLLSVLCDLTAIEAAFWMISVIGIEIDGHSDVLILEAQWRNKRSTI